MKTINIEIPKGYQIDEKKSTFTQIVFKPIEKKWVDLGLPSGTLWCDTNEKGHYSWEEMMDTFDKNSLPKFTDFAELYDYCVWRWDDKKRGMVVTGRNGNSIFMPAAGYRYHYDGSLYDVGSHGCYWSVTPSGGGAYSLHIDHDGDAYPKYGSNRAYRRSVRLIKRN